jgi:tRNA nucleotidyltransferase (CCA-adding enzyme)
MALNKEIEKKLEEIKEKLKPPEDEIRRLRNIFNHVSSKLNNLGNVQLMGSFAKGTILRNTNEIDVFLFIDRKKPIEKAFKEIMHAFSTYKYEIAYAQHPYLRVYVLDARVDIVPAYYISENEKPISAVDRTRLHTEYVIKNTTEKQRDDIRLLKQFLKNINAYGADIKTQGFSGYFCECLVIKKGNFINALRFFSNLEFETDENGNMIFSDPVDKERNLTASLSKECLSKAFIASKKFFELKDLQLMDEFFWFGQNKMKVKKPNIVKSFNVISIIFDKPAIPEDVRFGVLKKACKALCENLEKQGIQVINYYTFNEWYNDIITILTLNKEASKYVISKGPGFNFKQHLFNFIETNSNKFFYKDGILSIKQRKNTKLKDIVKDFFNSYAIKFYNKKSMKINNITYKFVKRELALQEFLLGD